MHGYAIWKVASPRANQRGAYVAVVNGEVIATLAGTHRLVARKPNKRVTTWVLGWTPASGLTGTVEFTTYHDACTAAIARAKELLHAEHPPPTPPVPA